jgi:hypothetical protein
LKPQGCSIHSRLIILLVFLTLTRFGFGQQVPEAADYFDYHSKINQAENHLANARYPEALLTYEAVFASFDFVFCRDYKIAAQVSTYLNKNQEAALMVEKALSAGWELKDAKKLNSLEGLWQGPDGQSLEKSYDSLRAAYLNRLDNETRETVHRMFKKDQKKAMGALLRIGDKAQENYAVKKFAPHSEQQLEELKEILLSRGYPGERRIGNDFWASTILSHHNSISREYNTRDTLYRNLRPLLWKALRAGQLSPYEFALIEDWKIATTSGRQDPGYGFLNPPAAATLHATDSLREAIGLRTVALRNALVDIEESTGMHFFLPDWVNGKIQVRSGE